MLIHGPIHIMLVAALYWSNYGRAIRRWRHFGAKCTHLAGALLPSSRKVWPLYALIVFLVYMREVADSVSRALLAEKLSASVPQLMPIKHESLHGPRDRQSLRIKVKKKASGSCSGNVEEGNSCRDEVTLAGILFSLSKGAKRGTWCRHCCLGTGHA